MNYAAHYDRIIARARGRVLSGYRECHHVIPRCMGGSDAPKNIVELTAEEHYIAHQFLVRMYPGHSGLAYAAIIMAKQCTGNRPYGWLRRRYAQSMLGSKRRLGIKHTAESKAKMSKSRAGKPLTPAQRAARIGRTLSAKHRANVAAAGRGRVFSKASLSKMSASQKGHPVSAQTRAKISMAKRGSVASQATKDKMSAARRGKKLGPTPEERRRRISATLKAKWARGEGVNQWTA